MHHPFPQTLKPWARRPLCLLGVLLALSLPAVAAEVTLPDVQKLVKQGQMPQALERIDTYLSGRPKDAQGRFLKGLILTEMNRPADAIAVFTKLTEDFPELPEPYNNLAVLYAQQKQYEKARAALEMAIRTHPSYAVAYENLGDVYAKLASQAYDKALSLDSNNSAAQGKLSLIRDIFSTSGRPPAKAPATAARPEPTRVAAAEPAARPAPVTPIATAPAVPAAPVPAAPPPKPTEKVADAPRTEVAKPVEPSRADKAPAERPADAAGAEADIGRAIAGWAAAWSRKDVKGYLAHYAPDFDPPGNTSRKEWETERQQRIDKPGKIQVSVDALKISLEGDKATVRFRQRYKSATLDSTTGKTLILIRQGGKWLIQQERVG